jgi:5-methylcytosine-specific restriction endonuclease McrA
MKLKITEKRLAANRKNSLLGAAKCKENADTKYLAKPSFCQHCNVILPRKKKKNKFCGSSCAAKHNNTIAPKRKAAVHNCPNCNKEIKNLDGKYCSTECYEYHRRKYKTDEEKIDAIRKNVRAISANYRARLRNQTPPNADLVAIKNMYVNCPQGYEVDHIIPISKGGLHVLENLQYLPAAENRRKSNKIV